MDNPLNSYWLPAAASRPCVPTLVLGSRIYLALNCLSHCVGIIELFRYLAMQSALFLWSENELCSSVGCFCSMHEPDYSTKASISPLARSVHSQRRIILRLSADVCPSISDVFHSNKPAGLSWISQANATGKLTISNLLGRLEETSCRRPGRFSQFVQVSGRTKPWNEMEKNNETPNMQAQEKEEELEFSFI